MEDEVFSRLRSIRDPVSGAPAIPLLLTVNVQDLGDGLVRIVISPRDPYSPTLLSYAEAVKSVALKVAGVKKILIECRNHVMADLINMRLNQGP